MTDKEFNKEYQRQWKERNLEHYQKYQKEYREAHKDKMKAYQKEYRERIKKSLDCMPQSIIMEFDKHNSYIIIYNYNRPKRA